MHLFEGKTRKGKSIFIRYPEKEDLEAMWKFINTLSKEKTFIRFQGEEISLEEEKKYLEEALQKITQKKAVVGLAFSGSHLIGVAELEMGDKTEKHQGVFRISIVKEARGDGIGTLLMQVVIEEAIRQITELEIVALGLFAQNTTALEIYKKSGFIELGRMPRGAKFENHYDDRIIMYKFVR